MLERILYKIEFTKSKAIVVLLSLTGCVLVSGAYSLINYKINAIGLISGVLSGVLFSAYSLMGKSSLNRNIAPWSTIFYTFGIASIFLLFINIISNQFISSQPQAHLFILQNNWIGWMLLWILAIVPTIGGYGLYNVSLSYLKASTANIIATMEPVFTAVQASMIIGEQYSHVQIFGGLLIFSSVIILKYSEKENNNTKI